MKKLLIEPTKWGKLFSIDFDNKSAEILASDREGINSIYLIDEPTKLIIKDKDGSEREENIDAGDIVITFYDSDFPNNPVVVKSAKWAENIKTFRKIQAEARVSNLDAKNVVEAEERG